MEGKINKNMEHKPNIFLEVVRREDAKTAMAPPVYYVSAESTIYFREPFHYAYQVHITVIGAHFFLIFSTIVMPRAERSYAPHSPT